MLDLVALNQARFNTPQVTPDNRGILLGKLGALLFASVDRMVGFFRVFCDESSIDELLPRLAIHQVQSALGSRELLVLVPATSSYLLDRCARITRLFGGLTFTGSGKHFVRYRDEAAPLGYDLQALSSEPGDFIVYNDTFTQAYTRGKELPLEQLLMRLSLRRLPGPDAVEPDEPVWVVAQPGLGRSVIGYLWRNHVEAQAAQIDDDAGPNRGSAFGGGAALWLVKVARMPARMRRLFADMPGVELHRAVTGECLVELGYRHPIRLSACAAVLDKSRFYIFSGTRDRVDVLAAPPPLTPAGSLFDSDYALREPKAGAPAPNPARVPMPAPVALTLRSTPGLPRRVTATLIDWPQAVWLKQLVYTLPQAVLDGARAAALREGFLILAGAGADANLEALPIGRFYYEAAPSVLVPFGYEVVPHLSPEVLAEHVGGTDGRIVLFPPPGGSALPVVVLATDLEPLSRRTVAQLELLPRTRDERFPPALPPVEGTVVNESLGLFPLWGFAAGQVGPAEPLALAAHDTDDDHDGL